MQKGETSCLRSASDLLRRAEAELCPVPLFPCHPAARTRNSKWGLNQTSAAPGFSSLTPPRWACICFMTQALPSWGKSCSSFDSLTLSSEDTLHR